MQKGGERSATVRKTREYVKDGQGWRCVEARDTVVGSAGQKKRRGGGGDTRGDGRIGGGQSVGAWTRPVAVVMGRCEDHGVKMRVVVEELH